MIKLGDGNHNILRVETTWVKADVK